MTAMVPVVPRGRVHPLIRQPSLPRQFGNRTGQGPRRCEERSRVLPARPRPVQGHLTAQQIIAQVAGRWGVTSADILGRSHDVAVTDARHNAIWRVWRDRPRLTPTAIGQIFHRDHTTVRSAIVRWQRLIDEGVAQP